MNKRLSKTNFSCFLWAFSALLLLPACGEKKDSNSAQKKKIIEHLTKTVIQNGELLQVGNTFKVKSDEKVTDINDQNKEYTCDTVSTRTFTVLMVEDNALAYSESVDTKNLTDSDDCRTMSQELDYGTEENAVVLSDRYDEYQTMNAISGVINLLKKGEVVDPQGIKRKVKFSNFSEDAFNFFFKVKAAGMSHKIGVSKAMLPLEFYAVGGKATDFQESKVEVDAKITEAINANYKVYPRFGEDTENVTVQGADYQENQLSRRTILQLVIEHNGLDPAQLPAI
jgi:hypothetical protein